MSSSAQILCRFYFKLLTCMIVNTLPLWFLSTVLMLLLLLHDGWPVLLMLLFYAKKFDVLKLHKVMLKIL